MECTKETLDKIVSLLLRDFEKELTFKYRIQNGDLSENSKKEMQDAAQGVKEAKGMLHSLYGILSDQSANPKKSNQDATRDNVTQGMAKTIDDAEVFKVCKLNLDDLEQPLGQGHNLHKMRVMIKMYRNLRMMSDPQTKNASLLRTALLVGLPGNGKTLLAKYFSVMGNLSFLNVEVSDIKDKYFGNTEKFIKQAFMTAQKHAPCMLFLDEIDQFFVHRDNTSSEAMVQTTNALITVMNELSTTYNGVFLFGATNRPYTLDEASLRRFGEKFYVTKPNAIERKLIFCKNLDNPHITKEQFERLMTHSKGMSAADIATVCFKGRRAYIGEAEYSTHFRQVHCEYMEPCQPQEKGAIECDVTNDCLYSRPVKFDEVFESLKANKVPSNFREERKLIEFAQQHKLLRHKSTARISPLEIIQYHPKEKIATICFKKDEKDFGFFWSGGSDISKIPFITEARVGGPAHKAGLRENDQIIFVNDKSCLNKTQKQLELVFSKASAETKIHLKISKEPSCEQNKPRSHQM